MTVLRVIDFHCWNSNSNSIECIRLRFLYRQILFSQNWTHLLCFGQRLEATINEGRRKAFDKLIIVSETDDTEALSEISTKSSGTNSANKCLINSSLSLQYRAFSSLLFVHIMFRWRCMHFSVLYTFSVVLEIHASVPVSVCSLVWYNFVNAEKLLRFSLSDNNPEIPPPSYHFDRPENVRFYDVSTIEWQSRDDINWQHAKNKQK